MAVVHRSLSPRRAPRLALAVAALALAGLAGACSEDIDGGAGCATLCPGTEIPSREVALPAITQERVVPGILETGTEAALALIDRKDTVQTRIVIRFDSLPTRYRTSTTTSDTSTAPITNATDASILLTLNSDASVVQGDIVLEAYDVDDGGDDTTTAGIESRIVAGRRIGTRTLTPAEVARDTAYLPIDNAFVQARINAAPAARRVRVAIRVTSARSVVLRVLPSFTTRSGPRIVYKQAGQTALLSTSAESRTPAGDALAALRLADFMVAPVRPAVRGDAVFAVGGIPARRTLLRFAIPDSVDDAAAILQAELRLVQVPDRTGDLRDTVQVDSTTRAERRDTVVVVPFIGVGGATVTEAVRASQLSRRNIGTTQNPFMVAPLVLVPTDSGRRSIDVAALPRRWRLQPDTDPRYLVLTAESEGFQSSTAYFWSVAASDPSLRPVLYIRYVPSVGFGLP